MDFFSMGRDIGPIIYGEKGDAGLVKKDDVAHAGRGPLKTFETLPGVTTPT